VPKKEPKQHIGLFAYARAATMYVFFLYEDWSPYEQK